MWVNFGGSLFCSRTFFSIPFRFLLILINNISLNQNPSGTGPSNLLTHPTSPPICISTPFLPYPSKCSIQDKDQYNMTLVSQIPDHAEFKNPSSLFSPGMHTPTQPRSPKFIAVSYEASLKLLHKYYARSLNPIEQKPNATIFVT